MNPYSREALADVPALTLLNPWGVAIARYGKDVENRYWSPPAGLGRLLIHSGKSDDEYGYEYLARLGYGGCNAPPVIACAIVAVVDLVKICHLARAGGRCDCSPRWAMPDQVHWVLGNVVALPDPVPARGQRGLWRPAPEILDGVAASLASLAWAPLVCRGRRVDGRGRAVGDPHGLQYRPEPGETYAAMELRARMERWKVGPRPADGSSPDAMCPGCAHPSPPELDLIDALRRSA